MASKRVKLNDLEGQLGERDAVIHELERKLDELKRLVKEKDERISYLEKKRFEPLRRARLFDYGLTGQSSNAKSSIRANTGLTSAQLERLLNDQWRMLKSEGKMAVSAEDCYLYLRQSRTGVTATQLQDDYQVSVSTLNERYVQMGSQLTYLRIKSTRTRLADSIGVQFTTLEGRHPDWLLEHSTTAWRNKFGARYRHVCIVDVTFLRTFKSANVFVSKKTYSHYKAGWGVAVRNAGQTSPAWRYRQPDPCQAR